MNTAKRFSVFLKNMNMGQKPRRRDNGEVSGGGGVWTSDNHKGESMNSSIAALLISVSAFAASPALAGSISFKPLIDTRDRKSVVWGKNLTVRVDLGGLRIMKTKTT